MGGILVFSIVVLIVYMESRRVKRVEEEAKIEEQKRYMISQQDEIHDSEPFDRYNLFANRSKIAVFNTFSVDPDKIHESATQDEIVRLVNLLACRTSLACMNQDKEVREEAVYGKRKALSWDEESKVLKIEWAEARKLALRISPELAGRMPHFSEFEPIKSYREEHLKEKAEKSLLPSN